MGNHIGQPGQLIPQSNDDWSFISRLAIASVTSQGTMGGLLVGGFVSIDYMSHLKDLYDPFVFTANENCWMAIDLRLRNNLRGPLLVRKAYLDKQSQGTRFQAAVR